jgi:DUF4097 and DUF4098 domain-containing protein YvlB
VGESLVIRVAGRSSRVEVTAVADADVRVSGGTVQQSVDGSFDISGAGGSKIEIRCPEQSSITVSTSSGAVSIDGALHSVHVVTASGRVRVQQAADVEVRTSSGRVDVGSCRERCRVTTQTGTIEIGHAGAVELSSTGGKVSVEHTDRAVVRTVSGRIELGATAHSSVEAHSMSGKIEVRVAGTAPARMRLTSTSGRIENELPEGDSGSHIEVTTTSGSIAIERR